ncbi:MAG: lipid-binding SYLF domain-containing protein [Verrucomicrobia bacterium]|nr:lipid-binding SYLF domain-containing protein [Verrucomicrobiota bacterium]
MKRLLLLSLVALFGASLVRAETTRADLVDRVETCEAILEGFQSGPHAIPAQVLRKAQAIIIVNQFKGAFLFGIKDGYGVILVKKSDGRWSLPVLVGAGEASLGLQVGANSIETIYVITDPKVPRMLFEHRFNVGVDAKAVAGPKAAEAEKLNKEILETPVLVYTKSVGLYAGATVKAGHLSRNDKANFQLHNTRYTMPELLYGDWVQPVAEVQPLIGLVTKLTR